MALRASGRSWITVQTVGEVQVFAAPGKAHRRQIVHAAHAQPALDGGVGDSELALPFGHQRDAAEMTAGGMAADKDALGIAAEAFGILVDPGDGACRIRPPRHDPHHAPAPCSCKRLIVNLNFPDGH
jgi:hypothetical protein